MYSRQTFGGGSGFGGGLAGPVPRDVWVLLGTLFFTFSLQFFAATAWIPALLRLTPAVWQSFFVWQLVTYPFAGIGAPSFWFLIELLILFMFARDILFRLGRRKFWLTLVRAAAVAAVAAVIVQLLTAWATGSVGANAFALMQGQHMVVVIVIAAFATLLGDATIYLFFVLPIRARWFLGLEILFAFLGYLGTKDLAGFLGICAAVGWTWVGLRYGGSARHWREAWLRLQSGWIRLRLAWMRRRRGIRLVEPEEGPEAHPRPGSEPGGGEVKKGPWVH